MKTALLSLLLLCGCTVSAAAEPYPGHPTCIPADDTTDVLVYLDGKLLTEIQEIALERDQTFSLKIMRLAPNSTLDVKVKFAGGLGTRHETRQADRHGTYIQLFDTPARRGSAHFTVVYTTSSGSQREKSFQVRVE